MTVRQYLMEWLGTLSGAVHENTATVYRSITRLHLIPAFGERELTDVDRDAVRQYLLGKRRDGRSPRACALHLAVLRRALFDAIDARLLTQNVATELWRHTPPELRVRRQPGAFALRDGNGPAILLALARDHPPMYRLVTTYALSAMRRNEGLGLQIDDLDFTRGRIRIQRQWYGRGRIGPPKGRRPRTIDMAEELRPVLEEAIHDSRAVVRRLGCAPEPAWLFRNDRTGVPWHPGTVNLILGRVSLDAVGKRIGPKAFRHTAATTLMNSGVSPRYVQGLLGHRDIATTMLYVADEGMRDPDALRVLGRKGAG